MGHPDLYTCDQYMSVGVLKSGSGILSPEVSGTFVGLSVNVPLKTSDSMPWCVIFPPVSEVHPYRRTKELRKYGIPFGDWSLSVFGPGDSMSQSRPVPRTYGPRFLHE